VWELLHLGDWPPSSTLDAATMIVHHVVSIALWPLSCYLKIAHFYLLHFELTELSSPFLQLRWFTRRFASPHVDALASAAFALSFFVVRTALVAPMLRAAWLARPWDGAKYPHLSPTVRALSTLSLPLPFLLNALWSVQIILMCVKTMKRISGNKSEAAESTTTTGGETKKPASETTAQKNGEGNGAASAPSSSSGEPKKER